MSKSPAPFTGLIESTALALSELGEVKAEESPLKGLKADGN